MIIYLCDIYLLGRCSFQLEGVSFLSCERPIPVFLHFLSLIDDGFLFDDEFLLQFSPKRKGVSVRFQTYKF